MIIPILFLIATEVLVVRCLLKISEKTAEEGLHSLIPDVLQDAAPAVFTQEQSPAKNLSGLLEETKDTGFESAYV